MTFLPIVARELRIAARRPATYRVRSGAALALVLIGMWYFLLHQAEAPHTIAMGLFLLLTGSAVLYCLLSGVWFTADCLSEEKREGTLGLLFLTDLKGYDVVLGKLAATSLNAFYAVLAFVPILALPLLLGGVTPGEFARMALVIVNTLFFSLALGIGVSAMSRSPRKAMAMTFALMLFFTAVLPAWGAWQTANSRTARGQVGRPWLVSSAGFSYAQALDLNYRTAPEEFWSSVAVIHGLGWLSLVLASLIAPRAWQDAPTGARSLRWREQWHWWSYGNLEERAGYRKQLLDQGAYFWLAARARLSPAYVWAALGVVACGWVWGLARSRRDWLEPTTYVLTGLLLNLVIKVWFGLEAGRTLAEDRRQGTLELLLSTPLTVKELLRGQLLALKRQFLGPVVVILAVFFLFMVTAGGNELSQMDPTDRSLWIFCWWGGMVMLLADLTALYWLGMWKGLTARNPTRAALTNLACILVLPWVALALGALAASLFLRNAENEPVLKLFLGLWFGGGLAVDLAFGAWARYRLLSEFRLAATQRYEQMPGFWTRLLGEREPVSVAPPPAERMADAK